MTVDADTPEASTVPIKAIAHFELAKAGAEFPVSEKNDGRRYDTAIALARVPRPPGNGLIDGYGSAVLVGHPPSSTARSEPLSCGPPPVGQEEVKHAATARAHG